MFNISALCPYLTAEGLTDLFVLQHATNAPLPPMDRKTTSRSIEVTKALTHSRVDETLGTQPRDVIENSDQTLPSWKPFSLRRRTLLSLAGFLACLAAVLGVLADFSKRNNGVSSASANDYYLWTYAPTALFTLLTLFWAEIERRALQLQPWKSMRSKFQPASKSVLLDYISHWNVFSLIRAVKNRHSLAMLGIAGSLLLKIITALSTGLFVLQNVEVTHRNVEFEVLEQFGSPNISYWFPNTLYGSPSSSGPTAGDLVPAAVVLGLAGSSMKPPSGTTKSQAFERFQRPSSSERNDVYIEATVEVFDSKLECERAVPHGHY